MAGANGYAAMVRKRAAAKGKPSKGKRRRLDDYETPEGKVEPLTRFVRLRGPILEPACGSGRMVKALRKLLAKRLGSMEATLSIVGTDIKQGHDFLKRTAKWRGDIVTNPPYRDGLADAFVRHALKLADGRVAMLMELKFLAGAVRADWLYDLTKPEAIIIIPERIYFIAGGKPIKTQFFSHCWIVWPPRSKRAKNKVCEVHWGGEIGEFG